MIEQGLKKPGKTKGGLAAAIGRAPRRGVGNIGRHIRLIKASEIQPIHRLSRAEFSPDHGPGRRRSDHRAGTRTGAAGGSAAEIELPFPIAEETIAFEVAGDSGAAEIRKWRHYRGLSRAASPDLDLLRRRSRGAAETGERYLKTIERGKSATMVNLTSFNAKPITGVKLEWIREICRRPAKGPDRDGCGPSPPRRARKAAKAHGGTK